MPFINDLSKSILVDDVKKAIIAKKNKRSPFAINYRIYVGNVLNIPQKFPTIWTVSFALCVQKRGYSKLGFRESN